MSSFDDLAATIHRRENKYPWRLWMDGAPHKATYSPESRDNSKGEWFFATPESFVVMLRARAKGSPLKVRIRSGENDEKVPTIGFVFYEPSA
jgi:hypothetical protein